MSINLIKHSFLLVLLTVGCQLSKKDIIPKKQVILVTKALFCHDSKCAEERITIAISENVSNLSEMSIETKDTTVYLFQDSNITRLEQSDCDNFYKLLKGINRFPKNTEFIQYLVDNAEMGHRDIEQCIVDTKQVKGSPVSFKVIDSLMPEGLYLVEAQYIWVVPLINNSILTHFQFDPRIKDDFKWLPDPKSMDSILIKK